YNTTLAFVHLEENGERSFSFYRNNSADYQLTYEACQWQNIKCKHFYFGSVALSKSPMKETVHTFLKKNKHSLDYVFFDPNYRPLLWQNSQKALDEIKKVIDYVDVIKVSNEEALWLTGQETYKEAITKLHKLGIKVIYLTLGDQGSLLSIEDKTVEIPPYKPHKVIDTTGAGDAFFGSVIGYLLSQKKSHDLREEDFIKAGNYGNVAGGLCVEGFGAVPSYPTKKEIESIINGMK
ncbi:carbohydrate kinase family protein, partial [Poseidonibacter sp.]|uniref:carbohydrate kinase family protein n=1 Tax=Poseidonibacter sp. TaxID=2321188 RepID=UPI003C776FAD